MCASALRVATYDDVNVKIRILGRDERAVWLPARTMCVQFRVAGLPGCRVAGWVPGGCRVGAGWLVGWLPGDCTCYDICNNNNYSLSTL